jgi:hypothetical protein
LFCDSLEISSWILRSLDTSKGKIGGRIYKINDDFLRKIDKVYKYIYPAECMEYGKINYQKSKE